jgi:hypothetical protein
LGTASVFLIVEKNVIKARKPYPIRDKRLVEKEITPYILHPVRDATLKNTTLHTYGML